MHIYVASSPVTWIGNFSSQKIGKISHTNGPFFFPQADLKNISREIAIIFSCLVFANENTGNPRLMTVNESGINNNFYYGHRPALQICSIKKNNNKDKVIYYN